MNAYNKNMKQKSSRKGFTLIEMLIVIAIIGILSSIVLVGLGPIQRRGRDARRQADLRQVQNALELYYNKCGYYPGSTAGGKIASGGCTGWTANNTWEGMSTALEGSDIGTKNIPTDPSSGATGVKAYQYGSEDGSSYVIAAYLEDINNPSFKDSPTGKINGIECGVPVYCIEF